MPNDSPRVGPDRFAWTVNQVFTNVFGLLDGHWFRVPWAVDGSGWSKWDPMWNETAPKGWFFEQKINRWLLDLPNFFRTFGWIWRLVKDSEKNMNQRWFCWWFVPCGSVLPWSLFRKFVGGFFVGNQQLTNFTLQFGSERILCFSSPNGLLYVSFFRKCLAKKTKQT